jgi:hypothetical protein
MPVPRAEIRLTPERFARGMTFDAYVAYVATPENLAREAGWWLGPKRVDWSAVLREWYEGPRLSPAQVAAIRWLAAQPGGPANVLVISEEWSSDCRRDVPALARLADAGGLELRIFTRDGATVGRGPRADPAESPNADLVNAFLNEKDGQTFQSVPVAAFFTREWRYLYHYVELPAVYRKERIAAAMQAHAATFARFIEDWGAFQRSPLFAIVASAAIAEILAALYERVVIGPDG